MTRLALPGVMLLLLTLAFSVSYVAVNDANAGVNRSIKVKGVFVLVDEESLLARLQQLSALNTGRQEFLVGVHRMLQREPYIASSSTRYSWPDDVVIEISEVSPVAIINDGELLLQDCKVMKKGATELPVKLIVFHAQDRQLANEDCRYIVDAIPMLSFLDVKSATIIANGDYILNVAGSQLVVGAQDIATSMHKIKKLVAMLANSSGVVPQYIDMRYASGVAIRRVIKP